MKVLKIYGEHLNHEFSFADGDANLPDYLQRLDNILDGDGGVLRIELPGLTAPFRASAIIGYSILDYDSPESIADSIAMGVARERADKAIQDGIADAKEKVGVR